MQVVATRSRVDAEAYAAVLAPRVALVAMPVMTAAALSQGERAALAAAIARPELDGLWLASVRSVGPIVSALQTQGIARPQRVYTVGPATAAAARAAGLDAESLGDDGRTAALALVARGVAGLRLLAPRAAAGRDDALDLLIGAGAEVAAVVAYRMIARAADDPAVAEGRAALRSGRAAACLCFAPSQVDALAAILGGLAGVRAPIAIGPTTAAALRAHGVEPAAVASTPTPAGMAAALAAVYPTER